MFLCYAVFNEDFIISDMTSSDSVTSSLLGMKPQQKWTQFEITSHDRAGS